MPTTMAYTYRLQGAIERSQRLSTKPPYSMAEMVVMALLIRNTASTEKEIFTWICTMFRFYRDVAIGLLFDMPTDDYYEDYLTDFVSDHPTAEIVRGAFKKAFKEYDVPLKIVFVNGEEKYTVSEYDGHRFLTRITGFDNREGTFPFFKLPAELRNRVYELLFQYPVSGICVHEKGKFEMITKFLDQEAAFKDWGDDFDEEVMKERIWSDTDTKVLAPLRVSRQFYQEAMPHFYQLNHFRFMDTTHLLCFLPKWNPERRDHIQRISLEVYLPPGYDTDLERTFQLLMDMKGLKRLHLQMDENQWLSESRSARNKVERKKYLDISNIPGLSILRNLRKLEELTFSAAPQVEAFVRADTPEPKPKKRAARGATSSSKKRKTVDGEGEAERRSERLKKAKA